MAFAQNAAFLRRESGWDSLPVRALIRLALLAAMETVEDVFDMTKTRRIALALPMGVPHLEEVVHGIRLFGQRQPGWDFVTSPETHSIPVSSLAGWDGDGVIAMVSAPSDVGVVKRLKCPVVNLSGAIAEAHLPRVRVDYELAGQDGGGTLVEPWLRALCLLWAEEYFLFAVLPGWFPHPDRAALVRLLGV